MDHTATTPQIGDGREGAVTPGPVANPRRTRLGADGRPVSTPVTPTGD